jgi:hypothetical protein
MSSQPRFPTPGNAGFSLCGISQNGTHRLKPVLLKPIAHLIEALRGSNPPRRRPRRHSRHQPPVFSITYGFSSLMPPKTPQCFLSLTDHITRNYQCFLSLTKKAGGGVVSSLPTGCEQSSLPTGCDLLQPCGDLKTSQPRGASNKCVPTSLVGKGIAFRWLGTRNRRKPPEQTTLRDIPRLRNGSE